MRCIYQLVGMKYRDAETFVASLPQGEALILKRDPFNESDMNAVEVWARGRHVAYIKGSEVAQLADVMDHRGITETAARLTFANRWAHAEVEL